MQWILSAVYSPIVCLVTESSVISLQNDVLILIGKENKEASAICFEIRIPKKKTEELLWKVTSKIYKKNEKRFGL